MQPLQRQCRAQAEGLESADLERSAGIRNKQAAALRLLYACLCPLDDGRSPTGPGLYGDFLESVPAIVRRMVRIPHVVRFMRAALHVPEGNLFLLLVLVDEGNKAGGFWEYDRPPQADGPPTQVCSTLACLAEG